MLSLHLHKYIAELLGTFFLTLVVLLSIHGGLPLPTPVLAALTLGIFVYTIGNISGTHINPSVTIGLWSVGAIPAADAAVYVASQFIGSILAMVIAKVLLGSLPMVSANASPVSLQLMGEIIGTFLLVFGVSSVVHKRVESAANGMVIGGSLLLGIMAAGTFSNGVLNPAVALGIGSFQWMYIVGPIVGSLLGAFLFQYLHASELKHQANLI
ncbi:MAG: major intrinsic protein [Candidatus Peribacteria bacterium]|nr:major intrinsic protein [Candidatus Peribacteria bacterium]